MTALNISSRRREGFRRIGRRFGPDGELIAANELTDEEVEAVKSEPNLIVEEVEADAQADDTGSDTPLSKMTKAELEAIAAAEGVDLSESRNNSERSAAIEAARRRDPVKAG